VPKKLKYFLAFFFTAKKEPLTTDDMSDQQSHQEDIERKEDGTTSKEDAPHKESTLLFPICKPERQRAICHDVIPEIDNEDGKIYLYTSNPYNGLQIDDRYIVSYERLWICSKCAKQFTKKEHIKKHNTFDDCDDDENTY
jgi:hypothetical protein